MRETFKHRFDSLFESFFAQCGDVFAAQCLALQQIQREVKQYGDYSYT